MMHSSSLSAPQQLRPDSLIEPQGALVGRIVASEKTCFIQEVSKGFLVAHSCTHTCQVQ